MGMYGEAEVKRTLEIDCSEDEVLTKQEFVEETDINVIIGRCLRTGGAPSYVNRVAPVFADVSAMGDFSAAARRVDAAQDAFMLLPAEVRKEFDNDVGRLLAFLGDAKNLPRAVELGLVVPRKAPEAPVPPASPAVPPSAAK